MKYFFWAMLVNATLGVILAFVSINSDFDFSLLSTLMFYGLILKGIYSLNKSETHFRTVLVLSVIILVGAVIQSVTGFINNTFTNLVIAWFAMVAGIGGIFAEYNLIKGIQSYKPVLNQPKEADRLLRYWKIIMFSSVAAMFTLIVGGFAFGIVLAMTYGSEQMPVVMEQAEALELIMEVAKANGVFFIIILVIFLIALLISFTCRILMIVSMNTISKDHQHVLANQAMNVTVE